MKAERKDNIFELRDLTVDFNLRVGSIRAVNGINLDIPKGKVTALVGESGSGKSTLASCLLNVVSPPGVISKGQVNYKGQNILKYNKEQLQNYKWKVVSMVFQAAQNALNPVMTVKDQMIETVKSHTNEMDEGQIVEKASRLLEYVRLEPQRTLKAYPHELSGGMKQRVMIAFSLLLDPELVILDEPTTALDVITQDYIFDILAKIHEEFNITMLLLTHDIAVVAKVADYIGVMYAGHIVEFGDIYDVFKNSVHPYTTQLLQAAPSLIDELDERTPISGSPPDVLHIPKGCPFHPRCPFAKPVCSEEQPKFMEYAGDHLVACHQYSSDRYKQEVEKSL